MKVSVIIPTFNRGALLAKTLESVFAQSRLPDDVIVVVDGSTDDTKERIAPFKNKIRLFHQENKGKAAALNFGLSQVETDWVWIVDDDDIVVPDALATLLALVHNRPDADIAYGRYVRFHQAGPSALIEKKDTGYWSDCRPDLLFHETLKDMFVHQPGMIVKKTLYDEVGGFDEKLVRSQDYDMLVRLTRRGVVASTDDVVFLQRQHGGARGGAGDIFDPSESQAKWMDYDKRLAQKFYDTLDPCEFVHPDFADEKASSHRRALIYRGAIMARKKMWSLALSDFKTACKEPYAALFDDEVVILRDALASKYGCNELLQETGLSAEIAALTRDSKLGQEIAATLSRGLMWRVREALSRRALVQAACFAQLVLRLRIAGRTTALQSEAKA